MTVRPYRTWVEVSTGAIRWNLGQFKRYFDNKALIAPVIKANGYGHDMSLVAKTLDTGRIWGFCVAYDTEAQELLKQGITKPILVLSAWQRQNLVPLIKKNVRIVVCDIASAHEIERAARQARKPALVHMKVDTGTTRIGTRPEHIDTFRRSLSASRWITVEGIFSHYADSESERLAPARRQRALFISALGGMRVPLVHMACSAASLRLPVPPTNLVRLGIGLYGLWPSDATRRHAPQGFSLRPALSWKTRVFQVKTVPARTTVGYARTYTTKRTTTIAVLPVGYADGYDRRASNTSHVMIRGRRCPVIGRVSMNLTIVDCGPSSPIESGDEVVLIGKGAPADAVAASWDTIHYEAVTRIDRAIPRIAVA